MFFYTDVSRSGNNILFSGYDNGEKVNRKYHFEPSLFVEDRTGKQYKSIDGKPVSEKIFPSIKAANDFVKQYDGVSGQTIYGMQNWVHQWIAKELPLNIKFDPALINILSFDIEVDSEGEGFPDPKLANHPVTAISFHFSTEPDTYYEVSTVEYDINAREVVKDKEVIYYRVGNEMDLLRTFVSLWQSKSPDILTGYNIQFFDVPYIVNRLNRLFGDGYAKCLSPWGSLYEKEKKVNNEMRQTFDIVGIQQLDYIDAIKKFGVALETPENYQLNTVAELIIGEGKVDFSDENMSLDDLYHTNPQKFIDYSIKDTYLVVEMENRVKFLQIAIMIAYKTGANFIDSLGTTAVWDAYIHRVLLSENRVIPPKSFSGISTDFEGGYVKEPLVGIHKWVVSFDFASLYPNIIVQHNISPETLVHSPHLFTPTDFLYKGQKNDNQQFSMTANGAYFKKDEQGIIPRLVEQAYAERVVIKNEMLELERALENTKEQSEKELLVNKISILKNAQHSVKILINSVYGCTGSKYFRYYDLRMAEGVTLTGQLAIHLTMNAINDKLSKMLKLDTVRDFIVFSDTDSVGIVLDEFVERFNPKNPVDFIDSIANDVISPIIDEEMTKMFEALSGYKKRLTMKRENICSGFFVAKKHYALLIYDAEGGIRLSKPKLKIKGIAAIKSSTPKAIRNKMKDIFLMILEGKTKAEILQFIDHVKKIFNSLPVERIAFPRGVKDIEKWQSVQDGFVKGTPIQVKAAMVYNRLIQEHKIDHTYQKIRSGDKLKFVYLKTPNPLRQNVIGFLNKIPDEFGLAKYIDYPKMFEKTFLGTVDPILTKIGFGSSSDSAIDTFSFFD